MAERPGATAHDLDALVGRAQHGDHSALEQVVRAIQDDIHHLAVRMLVHLEDARDATQEILILVVTKLSTFRGDSRFRTWVYRVAAHYLLDERRRRLPQLTFAEFEADLKNGLVRDTGPPADHLALLNELRVSCTMAVLLCLDVPHRMAYVLGDVLELDHAEASQVLGISKANYRQRLSRARSAVVAFTSRVCGLADDEAACTCPRRLPAAVRLGRVRAVPVRAARHARVRRRATSGKRARGRAEGAPPAARNPALPQSDRLRARTAQAGR